MSRGENPTALQLILDQGLPRSAARLLRESGVESDHVAEIGLAGTTDAAIMAEARRRKAIVATLDSDFHQQLAESAANSPSVIRIRIEGLKGPALHQLLHRVLADTAPNLSRGAAVSVLPDRVRVRSLPLTDE